ncbi:hypothetical protein Voc01_019590 [Virgisporangium ochraceum]|uniref:Tetratricopeptide repeat protein n=2 Tax=Virgisporangium ochraceum TaxID=65505 RepID=A0A8J3ZQ74_9ACTN|nr:hypothetical protein Voc01_019590 [Virgisporangium ochraceum]
MKALTSTPDTDLSRIHTMTDLAAALGALRERIGVSYAEIERTTRGWGGPGQPDLRELKTSTLNNALLGQTQLTRRTVVSLLSALGLSEVAQQPWLFTWDRLNRPTERIRFDEVPPQQLGIHSAITTPDTTDELPTYVPRDFDFELRNALSMTMTGPDRGCFVVLIGGSSSGKTRALYEAVYLLWGSWSLVQPEDAAHLLTIKNHPPRQTVFWLDELQLYLDSHPPLSAECVRALIRNGNVVVGTLWPDQYAARAVDRQPGGNAATDDIRRLLRSATKISVGDSFSRQELKDAQEIAARDSRIRIALHTRDSGLTQALAGGPDLVLCWEQPPNPYAKAIMAAAADAHRLGVQSPLSENLLVEAMFGYLPPREQVTSPTGWWEQAFPHVTVPRNGNVSALTPRSRRPGVLAGYTIADYLAQHLRLARRTEVVPDSAWQALVTRVDRSDDLRRLAESALTRLRYRYAEPALERLVTEFGDGAAAIQLADLLIRQNRFDAAIDVLQRTLATDPRNVAIGRRLTQVQELWELVEAIRPAGDSARVAELLVDGGTRADLRRRADAGDSVAAEQLSELLLERGHVRELHERADAGDRFAAEALRDLDAARSGQPEELAALREAAEAGSAEAARQLCRRLFELRAEDELWAELEAGTNGAADQILALLTAEESTNPQWLADLRAFGLNADGTPNRRTPPV